MTDQDIISAIKELVIQEWPSFWFFPKIDDKVSQKNQKSDEVV